MKPFLSDEAPARALFRWDDDADLMARIVSPSDPEITEALEALRDATRSDVVILVAADLETGIESVLAHTGARPSAEAAYDALRRAENNRADAAREGDRAEIGKPSWIETDTGQQLRCLLLNDVDRRVSIVMGVAQSSAHGADVLAAAEGSFPMLRPYVRLWRRLEAERRRAWELARALDQSDISVAILDARGLVHFANAAAERLFADEDGLRLSFGAVVATSLRDALRLRATIEHCLHARSAAPNGRGAGDTAHVLMIDRGSELRPLIVSVAALPGESGSGQAGGAVLFALRPEHDVGRFLASVCRLHGLSPVETRLACHLVSGRTISEAAVAMRIKEQTARAYLKQVFSKTETKRQAELVRLMMSNLLPVTARLTPENVP